MSDCQQLIDCCPPGPFDYHIPEQTFWNEQQCATASCHDGSNAIKECVAEGTVSSGDSKEIANQLAYNQALANAQAKVDASGTCQVGNVDTVVYGTCPNTPNGQTEACGHSDLRGHVPANQYYAGNQAAANDLAIAEATRQAQILVGAACTYWNDQQSYTAACDPPSIHSVTGVVAKCSFSSDLSKTDANNKAQAEAKRRAEASLVCTPTGATLSGLLWKIHCRYPSQYETITCQCFGSPTTPITGKLTGNIGTKYTVRFRIRGTVELGSYSVNGQGGDDPEVVPVINTVPGDTGHYCVTNCKPDHTKKDFRAANEYSLVITDAATGKVRTFYLNNSYRNADNPAIIWALDYTFDVACISGTSTVELVWNAVNESPPTYPEYFAQNNNNYTQFQRIIPDDPSMPLNPEITNPAAPYFGGQPYKGQWLQLDVVNPISVSTSC